MFDPDPIVEFTAYLRDAIGERLGICFTPSKNVENGFGLKPLRHRGPIGSLEDPPIPLLRIRFGSHRLTD